MKFKDGRKPKGVFKLKVFKDGELFEEYEDLNLIVNGGRDAIVKLIGAGTAGKVVDKISFGTDGTNPVLTDTAITGPFTKAIAGVTYPANETAEFEFVLLESENNGVTIREFGLLCNDNTLFSRKVRAAIVKTASIRLEGFWSITF